MVLGIIVRYHNNLHKMANHHTNEPNVEHINSVMLDEDMYNDFQKNNWNAECNNIKMT